MGILEPKIDSLVFYKEEQFKIIKILKPVQKDKHLT